MPERISRICGEPGCAVETKDTYCGAHKRDNVSSRARAYQYLYYTKGWKKHTRAAVLQRDPMCKDPFKIGCHNPSTDADHIIPHRGDVKLFFDLNNLQGLCKSCHSRKTKLEGS